MSVLFFKVMKYKVSEPKAACNDRFILSKGHAAPILYAAWAEAGLFPTDDLMNLRKIDSDLEGHPTPRLNFIDVATGSLGQGLSVACGMAYVGKFFDKASYRTYCLMGDGESMEGNIWEAFNFAGFYKLDNLCAIVDVNRLGQSDPAPLQHDMDTYRKRLEAFGFHAIVVDGHDINELIKAFDEAAATKGKPTCILANLQGPRLRREDRGPDELARQGHGRQHPPARLPTSPCPPLTPLLSTSPTLVWPSHQPTSWETSWPPDRLMETPSGNLAKLTQGL